MGLRQIEMTLPPGFRFYPSDEELICHYLQKKVTNETMTGGTLVEVDLHVLEPWELPGLLLLNNLYRTLFNWIIYMCVCVLINYLEFIYSLL